MTASRGRRNTDRGRTHQLILERARHLFSDQGYTATTLEQVASAAGLSMTALQRHFPAKIDLFRGLVEDLLDSTLRAWMQQTTDCSDPITRLHRLAETFLAESPTQGTAIRLMTRALTDTSEGEVQSALRMFALEWEEQLTGLIAEGQQSGFFRRTLTPRVGAWQLMYTALAVTLTQPLCMPLHDQADYAEQAIQCALQCLLKTDV